jgi:lysophospholipase L1-like esterase
MTQELNNKIVLLGDSLTEYWNWSDLSPKLQVVNQGIGGDTSMGLLSRVSLATDIRPRVISLQVGINDLSQGLSPAEIANNHLDIWREINKKSPKTHLIVTSLMPIRRERLDWCSDTLRNDLIMEINDGLKKNLDRIRNGLESDFRFESGISWLDLFKACVDNQGELPDHMTTDGVHLTWSAYWVWTEALRNHLLTICPQ